MEGVIKVSARKVDLERSIARKTIFGSRKGRDPKFLDLDVSGVNKVNIRGKRIL